MTVATTNTAATDVARATWQWLRGTPAVQGACALIVVPVAITVLFSNDPPFGVFLDGLVIGGLYGLLGMGIVLVHRATKVINFAQASLGAAPAALALSLYSIKGWPFWLCCLIMLIGSPLLGAGVERVVVRPFARSPRLILTVVLIGVGSALGGLQAAIPSVLAGRFRPPSSFSTPLGELRTTIGGVVFTGNHLAAAIAVVLSAVGVAAFFRYTHIGIAVRASAENGDRAALLGIPVKRVSTVVWAVAGLLSGLGVFFRAPLVGLSIDGQVGPAILLFALVAAVVARMESMPRALFVGMLLGMLDRGVYYGTGFNPNIGNALILPVLLLTLLVQRRRGDRALDTGTSTWVAAKEFKPVPHELRDVREVRTARTVLQLALVVLALVSPLLVPDLDRFIVSKIAIYAIVGVSLVVLSGWAGQISLGQFALVGVGAAVTAGLAADAGWDFFAAVAAGGVAGAAIAVVLGVPALRIKGLFLAVTTLAFAVNMQSFFLDRRYFGWVLNDESNSVVRPVLWKRIDVSSDLAFGYLCMAFLAGAVLLARSLRRSRSGRVLLGSRDNERAAQSYGINLTRTRLAAFAISGFLAAVAGALYAYLIGTVDAGAFAPQESISVFAMAVIGGLTSLPGAVAGAIFVVGTARFLTFNQALLVNGIAIVVVLRYFPGGLAEIGYRMRDSYLRRIAARHDIRVPSLVADDLGEVDGPDPIEVPPVDVRPAGAAERSRERVAAVSAEEHDRV